MAAQFLESFERRETIFSRRPPAVVALFVKHVNMREGRLDRRAQEEAQASVVEWFDATPAMVDQAPEGERAALQTFRADLADLASVDGSDTANATRRLLLQAADTIGIDLSRIADLTTEELARVVAGLDPLPAELSETEAEARRLERAGADLAANLMAAGMSADEAAATGQRWADTLRDQAAATAQAEGAALGDRFGRETRKAQGLGWVDQIEGTRTSGACSPAV